MLSRAAHRPSNKKLFHKVSEDGLRSISDLHFLTSNKDAAKLVHVFAQALRIGAFVQFRELLQSALRRVC